MRIILFMAVVIAACTAMIGVHEARTCSVPVFRYALERWAPDAYKGIVIFKDEMTKDEQALFHQLKNNAQGPDFPLNLQIQAVNTASIATAELEDVLKGGVPEELPVIAIWYPDELGRTAPFFSAKFDRAVVNTIAHSPKREELAKRLISKDAAVWIFLESGNPEKDHQAETFLIKELDAAAERLAQTPKPVIPGYEGKTLSYGFSILHLSQSDPLERFLLEMLLGSESDLCEHQDKPMIFPVFGRGRLLGALFGEFITEDNIQGAVSFMTGACSCEVKAMNPGTDLLMAAPWDRAVFDFYSAEEPAPELTGVMPDASDLKEPASGKTDEPEGGVSLLLASGLALVGILVVAGIWSMVVMRRSGRGR